MALGGKRPGAGRKPGVPNKDRREFLTLIQKIGKPEELLAKLKELANGVKCIKHTQEGDVVYEKPPDGFAISYMLDQAYGKAKQSMEIEAHVRTIEDELASLPD